MVSWKILRHTSTFSRQCFFTQKQLVGMAWSTTLLHLQFKFPPVSSHQLRRSLPKKSPIFLNPNPVIPNSKPPKMQFLHRPNEFPGHGAVPRAMDIIQSSPPTWQSAFLSNFVIFVVGSPLLVAGLSLSGICAAFSLGTLTWRAFGSSGFLHVASYFVIVSPHKVYGFYLNYGI
ncbi:Uncharacterized protein TCM_032096 [Theobroma cacao]|uniref:Uncharacterized protein n=1 Tax=Theobroma cacao TaxID=3641 RepID=A0A061FG94_THECC|nr:Uncharacterized protein TCM_032096 [Theobroma cacao]